MNRRFLLLALAAVTLPACGEIGLSATYLGSADHGTLAVAPAGWEVYDAATMTGGAATLPFLQGFGAGGNDPTWPMGGDRIGGILSINFSPDLTAAALAAENALVTDLAAAVSGGQATVVRASAPVQDGTWERRSWILDVSVRPGTVVRVTQQTMVGIRPLKREDGSTYHLVKALIVGCDVPCFEREQTVVDRIVESWDVH